MARRRFLEKTAAQIATALKETLVDEQLARRPGLLQRLDPRAKVVSTAILILSVALAVRLETLAGFYLLTLLLAGSSRLPMGPFLRRVWFFIPLFTAVIALPALFLTPGDALFRVVAGPVHVAVTAQGLRSAALLVLRVAGSVSLAVLLVVSTPWPALLKALRSLRVPQTLVLILNMARRYIFLLLQTAEDLLLARRSRMVGHLSGAQGRHVAAGTAGTLVARSYHLSQEVHLAMEARGFRGEVRLLTEPRLRPGDLLWIAAALLVGGVILWIGR